MNTAIKHADGTLCPEGTRSVPRGYVACCEDFDRHTTNCYYDVRFEWWPRDKCWVIVIAEAAGGGGIEMSFCPHCGAKLRGAQRAPARKATSTRDE